MDRAFEQALSSDRLSASDAAIIRQQLLDRDARIEQQATRIRQLEQLIKSFQQQRFGSSSEKIPPEQLGLFNEAEALAEEPAPTSTEVRAHTRHSRGRPALPSELPREDVIHDLDEADKVCPRDGTALKRIGEEISEQLEIIPAVVKVIRHVCLKYTCPCCEQHVATARKPKQALGKSMAGPGLLAYITTAKYQDALPLYRQVKIFERLGVSLDRTTLAQWMIRCGKLVQPLVNRLAEEILQDNLVHMDETPVQVLDEPGKSAQSKSYMWVLGAGPPGARDVVFHYDPGRSNTVPKQLLADYHGALMVDGYEGYAGACAEQSLLRLGCWAHARRKFVAARKLQPKGKSGRADQALAYIQSLYAVERQAKDLDRKARYALRREKAAPVIDQLHAWLQRTQPRVPPQSALGKALHYLAGQWPRLVRYLADGDYPIDNNLLENAIRPFALGRKNWLFAQSQAGARASANLYSLIESAKGRGLEPYAYLRQVFTALPNAETIDDVDALLPKNFKGGDS